MNMLSDYLDLVEKKKLIEKQILDMQAEIYNRYKEDLSKKPTGTFNFESDNFKIKIIKKETVSVDNEMAEAVGLAFKKKYSLDKKAFKELNDEQKRAVEECLTVKPSKPTFTIERI